MFTVQTTKEKQYTAVDIQKMLTNLAPRTGNTTMIDFHKRESSQLALKMVSTYLKANRWELFNTYAPFKIVTNGYGELTYIEMSETGKRYKADFIFRQMRKDEENGCTLAMVKV